MTAQEARAKAQEKLNQMATFEMQEIAKKIDSAINQGKFSVYISTISTEAKRTLELQGYKIQFNQGDFRDPRETSTYTISW